MTQNNREVKLRNLFFIGSASRVMVVIRGSMAFGRLLPFTRPAAFSSHPSAQ
jgi:hypothetical protein